MIREEIKVKHDYEDTPEEKICPLLLASGVLVDYNCRKNQCAWYDKNTGRCAVYLIATSILNIL